MDNLRLNLSINKDLSGFLGSADSLSLVVRDEYREIKSILNVLDKLSTFLKEKRSNINEWPGTILLLGTATVYYYNFSVELVKALSEINDSLFNWVSPSFPEDIVLYSNGKPLFVSITHERDCYLVRE